MRNTPAGTPAAGTPNADTEMADVDDDEGEAHRTHYTKSEIEQWAKNKEETRRPPLLPEHLREAARRLRMTQEGGLVGMLGLDRTQHATGVERFGNKFGGRRVLG